MTKRLLPGLSYQHIQPRRRYEINPDVENDPKIEIVCNLRGEKRQSTKGKRDK